jgi:protein-glutamine gamma-glutamyltransferase
LLYWRAMVFDYFDGRSWMGRNVLSRQDKITTNTDSRLTYQVTLEPHGNVWLIALEWPLEGGDDAVWTQRYELVHRKPVNTRLRYQLTSTLTPHFPGLTTMERKAALQLPATGNPEARQYAEKWRHAAGSDAAYIQTVLAYLRDNHFVYTLTPPILAANSVDGFLFSTRQGFCEHYASAFTFLMRAAHIPARVVTGYQGGEYNALGNYFIIHQYDAHAWSEVWLPERGWVRVDPTAMAAPERISQGLQASLALRYKNLPAWAQTQNAWIDQLRLTLDAVNNLWNEWILGYNEPAQRYLLAQLGFKKIDWQSLILILGVALFITMGIMGFYVLKPTQARKTSLVLQQYYYFCQVLAHKGIHKASHEGPVDFAQRAAILLPTLAHQLIFIGRYFALLYYGSYQVNPLQIERLKRQITIFKRKISKLKLKAQLIG